MSTTDTRLAVERALVELANVDALTLTVGAIRSRVQAAIGLLARARDEHATEGEVELVCGRAGLEHGSYFLPRADVDITTTGRTDMRCPLCGGPMVVEPDERTEPK